MHDIKTLFKVRSRERCACSKANISTVHGISQEKNLKNVTGALLYDMSYINTYIAVYIWWLNAVPKKV